MMPELSGMNMLLKTMGVNPDEIRRSIDAFMVGQRELLTRIEANQLRVEAKLDAMLAQQTRAYAVPDTAPTVELTDHAGRGLGVVLTEEKFPQVVLDAAAQAKPNNGQG